ncbi:hypothetical protein TorRG33x02_172690 [Trema orientale]|uniref:Uncharacterized protein n=1 Tax=Trema orientale TaxID=63057 RepID=A0A2P5EN36_TREOI|nr:hypothetical protein TorRG33x02_172690 [Trema orientale]
MYFPNIDWHIGYVDRSVPDITCWSAANIRWAVSHLKADVIAEVRHAMIENVDIFQAKTVEGFSHHGDIDSGEEEDQIEEESDDGGEESEESLDFIPRLVTSTVTAPVPSPVPATLADSVPARVPDSVHASEPDMVPQSVPATVPGSVAAMLSANVPTKELVVEPEPLTHNVDVTVILGEVFETISVEEDHYKEETRKGEKRNEDTDSV